MATSLKHFRGLESMAESEEKVTFSYWNRASKGSQSFSPICCMDLCGVGDCHLNLHAGLNVDGSDLLDDLGGRVQVDDTLVDPHLELVPGLGTLTARSLPGGHPEWALHLQLLVLGAPDQVLAHLLQGLHVPGGEGDPDSVNRRLLLNSLSILVCSHYFGRVSDCGQRSPALNLSTSCRSESSNKSLVCIPQCPDEPPAWSHPP